ncbi:MAG: hypothetical protein JXB47_06855 [Anaerolineae bacterium]|nr:hypothetical protein [Anaerolineae bacterium]
MGEQTQPVEAFEQLLAEYELVKVTVVEMEGAPVLVCRLEFHKPGSAPQAILAAVAAASAPDFYARLAGGAA